MENWLSHEVVELRDMVLSLKISLKTLVDVVVKQRTLSDKGINLLFSNLPRYSVNQKRILDRVELRKHWV